MDEMNIDGDDNVQINAEGDVVSAVGDGAIAAGRDITINQGIPLEKYEEKIDENNRLSNENDELRRKLASIEDIKKSNKEVEEDFKEALNDAKSLQEKGFSIDPENELRLGVGAWFVGKNEEAEIYFNRALLETKGKDEHLLGATINNLARVFQSRGLVKEANRLLIEALSIAIRTGSDSEVLTMHNNLAINYHVCGENDKYKLTLDDAILIINKSTDDISFESAAIYNELSTYYQNVAMDNSKRDKFNNMALELLDSKNEQHQQAFAAASVIKISRLMDERDLNGVMELAIESIRIAEQIGDIRTIITIKSNLCRFLVEVYEIIPLSIQPEIYIYALKLADDAILEAEKVGEFSSLMSSKLTKFYVLANFEKYDDAGTLFKEIIVELKSSEIDEEAFWNENMRGFPFEIAIQLFGTKK